MKEREIRTRVVYHLGDKDNALKYDYTHESAFEHLKDAYISNTRPPNGYRELKRGHRVEIDETMYIVEDVTYLMWEQNLGVGTGPYPFGLELYVELREVE